jgi:hypothetical protein
LVIVINEPEAMRRCPMLNLPGVDICRDPTGLRVKVEDIDIYDYVHFSVIIEGSDSGEDEAESGQMSHVAFARRLALRNAHRNPTIENCVGSLGDFPRAPELPLPYPCQVTASFSASHGASTSLFESRQVQAHIPGRQRAHFLWQGLG